MKILKKISKKITALLLSMSLLFSNLMPITTVFATLTEEEKDQMVELRMRGATSITLENGLATINYEGGYATVSDNGLVTEQINDWDYGNNTIGTMHLLFSSSTNLTFNFYPEEDHGVSYRIGGDNPERPENNTLTINNLLIRTDRIEGYDLEFQFPTDGGNNPPQPTGATYPIQFGDGTGASWTLGDVTVTASVENTNLADGFIDLADDETITFTNFDSSCMGVEVSTRDGFRTYLVLNEYNETYLANIEAGALPFEEDLYINVVPRSFNGENGSRDVEFGPADWTVDGVHVVASIEDLVLNNGPVNISQDTIIHLEDFDSTFMEAYIVSETGFRVTLFVDEYNNTTLQNIGQEFHLPDELLYFNVNRIGASNEPENEAQDGEYTATIRVNGVEGTYSEWHYDEELGEEVEEQHSYDGRGSIANETRFNVNDGHVWRLLPDGETDDDKGHYLYNEIEYNYDREDGDTTISLGLFTPWHMKFSDKIRINNVDYPVSDYIDYDDKESWISHINNDVIGFYINVPIDPDDIYEITVQIDYNEIEFLSEFNWTNNPERSQAIGPDGEPLPDVMNPEYMEHVKMELVNVTIDLFDEEYYYDEDDFNQDFLSEEVINYERHMNGEYIDARLFVPSDTVATIRLTPDPGYQVTDIEVEGGYIATNDPCEYIITIPRSIEEFHVTVTEEEDIVENTSSSITSSNILLAEATVLNGNYEFIISDMENDHKATFDAYADGYNINAYFNLTLNQVFNKASNDLWRTELESLNKKATITIVLNENISADQVVVIHNTSGTNFETITPTNVGNNSITFESKRFGDFAIASMNLTAIEGISVTVTPPVPGTHVNVHMEHDNVANEDYPVADLTPTVSVPNNANYTIDSANWVNGTCHGGANLCNEFFNGTFDQNNDYYALISVSANPGYKFTYDTLDNITVNGRALDTSNGDEIFNIYGNGETTMFVVKISTEAGEEPEYMPGDFNGNGTIDLPDVIRILKLYLGIEETTDETRPIGDINGDGTINLPDVISALRIYLGID